VGFHPNNRAQDEVSFWASKFSETLKDSMNYRAVMHPLISMDGNTEGFGSAGDTFRAVLMLVRHLISKHGKNELFF